jgi:hypothetical protein
MNIWTIQANYDPEARVWYTVEGEVPGLAVDAPSIEELAEKAGSMLEELLEIHADDYIDKSRLRAPHALRIVAFHERTYDVAA